MKTGFEFPQPIQHPVFHCDNCHFDFALLNVWEDEAGNYELTPMGEHTDGSWYCPHCGCKQKDGGYKLRAIIDRIRPGI